jgi:hypothetical protein
MRYLETRYGDNNSIEVRLLPECPEQPCDDFSYIVELIGCGGDFETLAVWMENFSVAVDDVVPLTAALESGKWVDVSDRIQY